MKNNTAQNDEQPERKSVKWACLAKMTQAEYDIVTSIDYLQQYMQEEMANKIVTYITTRGTK
jgi:hypothetical protein